MFNSEIRWKLAGIVGCFMELLLNYSTPLEWSSPFVFYVNLQFELMLNVNENPLYYSVYCHFLYNEVLQSREFFILIFWWLWCLFFQVTRASFGKITIFYVHLDVLLIGVRTFTLTLQFVLRLYENYLNFSFMTAVKTVCLHFFI